MDLGRLQEAAADSIQENIETFDDTQREIAETKAAQEELAYNMQVRTNTFESLTAIATHYTGPNGVIGCSLAIPIGRVTVEVGEGNTVTRNLHAVVRNIYNATLVPDEDIDDPSGLVPEKVDIKFYIEAEDGDANRGLIKDSESIGFAYGDGGDRRLLYGEPVDGHEYYDRHQVPRPRGSNVFTDAEVKLIVPDQCDRTTAEYQSAAINEQLPTMQETLGLLQAGIRATYPEAAHHLARVTRDISFLRSQEQA